MKIKFKTKAWSVRKSELPDRRLSAQGYHAILVCKMLGLTILKYHYYEKGRKG